MALALALAQAQNGEIKQELQRFDVVVDDSDHYFLNWNQKPQKKDNNNKGGDHFTNGANKVHKKIMQEWKILDRHLPETILVRVYEQRIDLLRAVIVGAAGTPYHDGLFFFDIAFPPDYPAHPPQVHYRSFGLRINPNLYANGRVCLSLLNTWTGKKNEKWNPSGSTILQVLVSIQGLVLNEKPYLNEPGVGVWTSKGLLEKKCKAYNADVFVLSCKTMVYLLRRPPQNFEGFVAEHFRKRAIVILSACNAYKNGCIKVGFYRDGDGSSSSSSSSSDSAIEVSSKFKTYMEYLYPELLWAFERNGASLGNFVEQVEVKKKKKKVLVSAPQVNGEGTASSKQHVAQKKIGIGKKIMEKMMKILGLKMSKENKAKP